MDKPKVGIVMIENARACLSFGDEETKHDLEQLAIFPFGVFSCTHQLYADWKNFFFRCPPSLTTVLDPAGGDGS